MFVPVTLILSVLVFLLAFFYAALIQVDRYDEVDEYLQPQDVEKVVKNNEKESE